MKKRKKLLLILTCATLALTPASVSAAEAPASQPAATITTGAPASQPTATITAVPTPAPKKQGWVTLKSGKKRYYKDGKRLTGLQKIGKKYYYFNSNGTMLKNKTIKRGVKNFTYFIDKKGYVIGKKKGSTYYNANGKKMSQAQIADLRSKQIVAQITNPHMSKSEKLRTCFNWVMHKYYYTWRRFDQGGKNWPAVNANDHFLHGKGDCVADASAFAYLAKAIGYKKVYVCADAKRSNNSAHSWAEINGYVYDPLFAEAKSYSRYYRLPRNSYELYAVTRYKVS